MIVDTVHGRLVITTHAVRRYGSRIARHASVEDVVAALEAAELRWRPPAWVHDMADPAEAYLLTADWVCPLRTAGPEVNNAEEIDFIAVTFIVRRRRPKAEVRMWREQSREESWAA